ncbi:hypothetical protein [Lacticaseibacillus saniviri]
MEEKQFAQQMATVLIDAVAWHHMRLSLEASDVKINGKYSCDNQ